MVWPLLEKVNGKSITLKNQKTVTLSTEHAPVIDFVPDWKTKILTLITDPNVALILMSIGVYGLILEFYNPGALLPGTIGAISLTLGLYAMNILPINAAGMILMGLGFLFIIAESFIPSFGIMGVGGVIAFMFGGAVMFDTESMPGMAVDWGVLWSIGLFGLLLVGLIVFLTVKVYRKKTQSGPESMIGAMAIVQSWDGDEGRVLIQGESWQATSEDKNKFQKDEEVLISAVKDLVLKVRSKP